MDEAGLLADILVQNPDVLVVGTPRVLDQLPSENFPDVVWKEVGYLQVTGGLAYRGKVLFYVRTVAMVDTAYYFAHVPASVAPSVPQELQDIETELATVTNYEGHKTIEYDKATTFGTFDVYIKNGMNVDTIKYFGKKTGMSAEVFEIN